MRAAADWIYGIVTVLFISSVALQAVPKGAWQKYVKLFCGGMMILTVTAPVFSLLGRSGRTALYYQKNVLSSLFAEIEGSVSGEQEKWREEAQKRQEAAFEEPLSALAQSYGFTLCSYSLLWKNENEPAGITLYVQAAGHDGNREKGEGGPAAQDETKERTEIVPVEPVEKVGAGGLESDGVEQETAGPAKSGPSAPEPVYYEPSELRELHEALETVLELPSDQVVIYLQREAQNE